MSDADMLKALIEKAIERGCTQFDIPNWTVSNEDGELYFGSLIEHEGQEWFSEDYEVLRAETILFSRDFAKALFGEDRPKPKPGTGMVVSGGHIVTDGYWKDVLKEAVVSENPIKYMYKHAIEEKK